MDVRSTLSTHYMSAEKRVEDGDISQDKMKYNIDSNKTIDYSVVSSHTSEVNNLLEIFPFVCGLCYCKFSKILPYYEHLRQHDEVDKESFFDCNTQCKENTCATFQPYHCAICNLGFVTICQLHFHIIEEENMDIYVYEHGSRTAGLNTGSLNFCHQSASGNVSEENIYLSKLASTSENAEETSTNKSKRTTDHEHNLILNIPEICSKRIVSKNTKSRKHDNVDTRSIKHLQGQMLQSTSQRKCVKNSLSDKISKALDLVDLPIKQEYVHGIYEESSKQENSTAGNVLELESVTGETEPKEDIEVFRQIEKHQLELKKRREKYRNKVKGKTGKRKMEKSSIERNTSICIKNEQNSLLCSTNTFIRNEEDIQALVDYVREKTYAISSTATNDDNTGCKTQTEDKERESMPKDAVQQIKKLQTDNGGQKISANDVVVPCHICGRMYKKRHLKKHLVSHQETRSFLCDVCNKYFKTKEQLHHHKGHHVTERNFVCRYCGKAFNTKGNLRQHERSHTAKKIYQCPFCPDKFASQFILKSHIVIHSDAKPYTCDICNQGFKRKDQLHRHQLVHTDKRPFSCSTCKKAFKTKRDCLKHEAIHQPARHFCGFCNKAFVSKSNMRVHERIHTREIK